MEDGPMMDEAQEAEGRAPGAAGKFLPLRPVELQILVGLGPGPRHGYGILQDAEDRGEGEAVPGLATLYRALRRLDDQGLIETCAAPDDVDEAADPDRRRYFRLTGPGHDVLDAEVARLRRLVEEVDLVEEGGPA